MMSQLLIKKGKKKSKKYNELEKEELRQIYFKKLEQEIKPFNEKQRDMLMGSQTIWIKRTTFYKMVTKYNFKNTTS